MFYLILGLILLLALIAGVIVSLVRLNTVIEEINKLKEEQTHDNKTT